MSGKDLLAVLAMIVPGFLLIALIAVASLPFSNMAAAPPGAGLERNKAEVKKARVAGGAAARVKQAATTQDMIRDFWGRPYCASCVQVSVPARCNSSAHDDGRSC